MFDDIRISLLSEIVSELATKYLHQINFEWNNVSDEMAFNV